MGSRDWNCKVSGAEQGEQVRESGLGALMPAIPSAIRLERNIGRRLLVLKLLTASLDRDTNTDLGLLLLRKLALLKGTFSGYEGFVP
jgi:hypothetical protein